MADIVPIPAGNASRSLRTLSQRLSKLSLKDICDALGKDDSTASRIRSGDSRLTLSEFTELLSALHLKLVDQDRVCVDKKTYEAMAHINARAMRDADVAKRLMWDEDEPE